VYDWGRPPSKERPLHIPQSLRVARHAARAETTPPPEMQDGTEQVLCTCDYFTLCMLSAETQTIPLDTRGESFHALTVIEGGARLTAGAESVELTRFDTVLVPAASGAYRLQPMGSLRALKSSV
jgi:mannose-6-phosphate isomerase